MLMLSRNCKYSKKIMGLHKNIKMVNFAQYVLNNKNKIVCTTETGNCLLNLVYSTKVRYEQKYSL